MEPVQDSLEYLEPAVASDKPRLLGQLKALCLSEAFLRLAHALEDEAATARKDILNVVPGSMKEVHEREQAIGLVRGLERLSVLHNDLIKKLENDENESRGTTIDGRAS